MQNLGQLIYVNTKSGMTRGMCTRCLRIDDRNALFQAFSKRFTKAMVKASGRQEIFFTMFVKCCVSMLITHV